MQPSPPHRGTASADAEAARRRLPHRPRRPRSRRAPRPLPRHLLSSPPREKQRRRPVPFALKAIAGLVIVAVTFIVAAILGGSGSMSSAPISAHQRHWRTCRGGRVAHRRGRDPARLPRPCHQQHDPHRRSRPRLPRRRSGAGDLPLDHLRPAPRRGHPGRRRRLAGRDRRLGADGRAGQSAGPDLRPGRRPRPDLRRARRPCSRAAATPPEAPRHSRSAAVARPTGLAKRDRG